MAKDKSRNKGAPAAPAAEAAPSPWLDWRPWALLLAALFAGLIVYSPATNAGWFYDDGDYVILDPRLDHFELYLPNHWHDAPPPLQKPGEPPLYLPGYDKPIYAERFLWHFSFALERKLFGLSPQVAHGVNIFLHLVCVTLLFFVLWRLLELYFARSELSEKSRRLWRLLPGLAALFFAVHPWASEPVCYVSARNGSMGAMFTLAGLWCWTWLFSPQPKPSEQPADDYPIHYRILGFAGAMLCAVLAYACKENFIAASAGYVLATWPMIWSGSGWSSKAKIATFAGLLGGLIFVLYIGINMSDRASGLFAQIGNGAGWKYLFEVQSPILLMTCIDQLFCRRISLETNYPGWPDWACAFSLLANAALIVWSLARGKKQAVWLGLAWFYVFLLPTNSFLPRPDFLGGRNVYLPMIGIVTLLAAGVLALMEWVARAPAAAPNPGAVPIRNNRTYLVIGAAAGLWLYFAIWTYQWAQAYTEPLQVWQHCVRVAPDHAVVRLNMIIEMSKNLNMSRPSPELDEFQNQLAKVLVSEDSPTMRYHTARPKQMARSMVYQFQGEIEWSQQRYKEAEEKFRQSWMEMPRLPTWVLWLNDCDQAELSSQREDVLRAGEHEWPSDWWPVVARGLARFQRNQTITAQITRELSAAEQAPNCMIPGLIQLQCRALLALAQTVSDKQRAMILLERTKQLGADPQQVDELQARILNR